MLLWLRTTVLKYLPMLFYLFRLSLMIRIHLNDNLSMSEEEKEALKTADYSKSFLESHK